MSSTVPKIYLDACCLNRPFDDQNQDRIKIETEAIIIILKNARVGLIKIIGSDVLTLEINKTPEPVRKSQLLSLTKLISKFISTNNDITQRAKKLQNSGLHAFDSLHIACAESLPVNVFLTTDDKVLKLFSKGTFKSTILVANPVTWLEEYLLQ